MTHIKFCGLTNLEDAIAAIEAGADMLGFNFYNRSPRFILPEQCALISRSLRQEFPQITLVGVFVNMPGDDTLKIMDECSLDLAQLHGDEPPEILPVFSGRAFKAFRGIPSLEDQKKYSEFAKAGQPTFLVDASVQGVYGGSGQTADWPSAAELALEYPILLAGGLNPENINEALNKVHPWGVDAASGVEIQPGKKDKEKMRAFVEKVRNSVQSI